MRFPLEYFHWKPYSLQLFPGQPNVAIFYWELVSRKRGSKVEINAII
jgi:hypothetical protein